MQTWKTRDIDDSYPPLKTSIYRKGVGGGEASTRIRAVPIVNAKGRTAYQEGEAGSGRVETVL